MTENFTLEQMIQIRDELTEIALKYVGKGLEIEVNTSSYSGYVKVAVNTVDEKGDTKEAVTINKMFPGLVENNED